MPFNSFKYLWVFLPVVVVVCILLRKSLGPTAARAWVLGASVVFYGFSKPADLIYLALSILANWLLAGAIGRAEMPNKKRILVSGLVLNVAYLGLFKYLGFFASVAAPVLPSAFHLPPLAFPLGVSFFTITQIMYLVDTYEGLLDSGSLFDHASFVAFFPYLISGPLGRAKRMRHQFSNFGGQDGLRADMLARGIFLFSIGLVKKALLASAFSQIANWAPTIAHPSAAEQWLFSVAYMMELYFDFSGYSDMAIGSAMMLGIEIPRNFDAPYRATSITEYWQRWHISLSQFITTYMFTPLLKSFRKRTLVASSIATLVSMAIAGLWHGAAWTFVVYGLLNGVYLAVNAAWRKKRLPQMPAVLGWLMTLVAVDVADTYFSASSLREGTFRVLSLFNLHHPLSIANLNYLTVYNFPWWEAAVPLGVAAILTVYGPSSEQLARDFKPSRLNCACAAGLALLGFLFTNSSGAVPFIYFKF